MKKAWIDKYIFAAYLAARMEEKHWNQSELLRRTGLGSGHVSMLLAGLQAPGPGTVEVLAQAFGEDTPTFLAKSEALLSTVGALRSRKTGRVWLESHIYLMMECVACGKVISQDLAAPRVRRVLCPHCHAPNTPRIAIQEPEALQKMTERQARWLSQSLAPEPETDGPSPREAPENCQSE